MNGLESASGRNAPAPARLWNRNKVKASIVWGGTGLGYAVRMMYRVSSVELRGSISGRFTRPARRSWAGLGEYQNKLNSRYHKDRRYSIVRRWIDWSLCSRQPWAYLLDPPYRSSWVQGALKLREGGDIVRDEPKVVFRNCFREQPCQHPP